MQKARNVKGQLVELADAFASWDELAAPMVSLGFEVIGYDPNVLFRSKSIRPGWFQLSAEDLKIINAAILK